MTPEMNAAIERAQKFGIDIFNMTVHEEATLEQRFEHLDKLLAFMESECEYILTHIFKMESTENKKGV